MTCFAELQERQAGTMFRMLLVPPLASGTLWSRLTVRLVNFTAQ